MARLSARQAQLQEQRRTSRGLYSGGKIRVLTPANTGVSAIAKRTANSELDVMTKNYNDGQVSNQDFKNFLMKMQLNPGLTEQDRADVKNKIADFDSRIQGETLVAAYNKALDNTPEQYRAALALKNYYNQRAAGMQPDTPAYNDNIQKASQMDQKVVDVQKNMNLVAQKNLRYAQEATIGSQASGSSAESQAKANKWKSLYDLATAQGDTTDAARYAANYNAEIQNTKEAKTKETTASNKKTLSDFINKTINDYNDGKITGEVAKQQLQQADAFASNIGDTGTSVRLNSIYNEINREMDKGITHTPDGAFGDKSKGSGGGEFMLNPDGSVSLGGSSGGYSGGSTTGGNATGTGGGTKSAGTPTQVVNGNTASKSFAQLDVEYMNEINAAHKALLDGSLPAQAGNPADPNSPPSYAKSILLLQKSRQVDLQNIVTALDQIATSQPDSKLGKKAKDQLDNYTKELTQVTQEYNGIRTGNLVLSMNKDKLEFVSKAEVPNAISVNGIYHKPYGDKVVDSGGNPIKDANGHDILKSLAITDTQGNAINYTYDTNFGGYLPDKVGPKTSALYDRMVSEKAIADKAGQTYVPNLMNYNQINNYDFAQKTPIGTTTNKPEGTNILDQAKQAGTNLLNTVTGQNVTQPKPPISLPSDIPLNPEPSSTMPKGGSLPSSMSTQTPLFNNPKTGSSVVPGGNATKPTYTNPVTVNGQQQPGLSLAGTPPPNNFSNVFKPNSINIGPAPITQPYTPPVPTPPKPNLSQLPQQKQSNPLDFLKGLGTKIFSFFGGKK